MLVSSHKPKCGRRQTADPCLAGAFHRGYHAFSVSSRAEKSHFGSQNRNPITCYFKLARGSRLDGMPLEKTFDFDPQLARADRLAHIVGESGGHRVFAVAVHRAGCEGQDRSCRKLRIASKFSDNVESIHPWHVQIENDEIRSKVPCSAQGLQAVRHLGDFIATTFKNSSHKLAAGGVVICYQDMFLSARKCEGQATPSFRANRIIAVAAS